MPADPVPDGDPLIQIILLLVLILVNAFFAASEIAVITLNDNKIQKMAEEGHKKAQKILKLTKNSSRFLSTIQIGVTLSGFLTSASASQSFAKKLADVMTFLPFSPSVVEGVATVIITIILSYFSLVLGELVPKKIAMQKSEALAFRFIGVLNATATIFKPFVSFLTVSTNFVLRLLRIDPNASEETVTEEEILMMVDVGEQKGVIQNSAKDMIANIFEFDDTTVTEIMTHRTDMTAVEDTSSISEAVNLSIENGYSRIPVYHEDLDDIVGIVYVKDLLKYVCSQMPEETKRCSELFAEMTASKTQMAIIVDEYGGTEGLVTMEDLVEAIVGNIQDEYDNEEEEIHKVNDNTFTVDGTASIDEISDLLGITFPEGDYDTVSGLVIEYLGHIPKPGEHPTVNIENVRFTVEQAENRRIDKVLIVKPSQLPEKTDSE